ncbi:MAG: PTS sugar transporter subunit IIA [Planctomycetes bacterium]|nr:PTS sugar transporter subunit IIA [Planctomycetota bacterium]
MPCASGVALVPWLPPCLPQFAPRRDSHNASSSRPAAPRWRPPPSWTPNGRWPRSIAASKSITTQQVRPLHAQFLARERLASTGVGAGVAIPHVKLEGLKETALAFAVHPAGVEWAALDGEVVHLVFAVVRPAESGEFHDPKRHLELMQWIAHLSRAPDFRRFALAAASPKVLHELLSEVESA